MREISFSVLFPFFPSFFHLQTVSVYAKDSPAQCISSITSREAGCLLECKYLKHQFYFTVSTKCSGNSNSSVFHISGMHFFSHSSMKATSSVWLQAMQELNEPPENKKIYGGKQKKKQKLETVFRLVWQLFPFYSHNRGKVRPGDKS